MKYIYIDTNQYRHLFSRSEGFSDSVYELLMKLVENDHARLLLPQQTKDEIERNRARDWPNSEGLIIENKCTGLQQKIDKTSKDFANYKSLVALTKEVEKEKIRLNKNRAKTLRDFTSARSKPNQKLKKLYAKATLIPETPEIQHIASFRRQKGNPPHDGEGIGDALIWESLLSYLGTNSRNAHLIFVAYDKDAWGSLNLDPFLAAEYKSRVGGKISYSNRLSDIPDLTTEEQEKIRQDELEHLKQNAVTDFVDSPSFVGAGERVKRLLKYKDILTESDYQEIVKAAATNSQIYQSFFTSDSLQKLVRGENGYVIKKVENIDPDLWHRFVEKNQIDSKRQSDQQNDSPDSGAVDPDKIPF